MNAQYAGTKGFVKVASQQKDNHPLWDAATRHASIALATAACSAIVVTAGPFLLKATLVSTESWKPTFWASSIPFALQHETRLNPVTSPIKVEPFKISRSPRQTRAKAAEKPRQQAMVRLEDLPLPPPIEISTEAESLQRVHAKLRSRFQEIADSYPAYEARFLADLRKTSLPKIVIAKPAKATASSIYFSALKTALPEEKISEIRSEKVSPSISIGERQVQKTRVMKDRVVETRALAVSQMAAPQIHHVRSIKPASTTSIQTNSEYSQGLPPPPTGPPDSGATSNTSWVPPVEKNDSMEGFVVSVPEKPENPLELKGSTGVSTHFSMTKTTRDSIMSTQPLSLSRVDPPSGQKKEPSTTSTYAYTKSTDDQDPGNKDTTSSDLKKESSLAAQKSAPTPALPDDGLLIYEEAFGRKALFFPPKTSIFSLEGTKESRAQWWKATKADYWDTLFLRTLPKNERVPLLHQTTLQALVLKDGSELSEKMAVVYGHLPKGWNIRFSGRAEGPSDFGSKIPLRIGDEEKEVRSFVLWNVEPGAHLISIEDPNGTLKGSVAIAALPGNATYVDLSSPVEGILEGTVYAAESKDRVPLPNVQVSLVGRGLSPQFTTESGRYHFPSVLRFGSHPLYVETESSEGYKHRYKVLANRTLADLFRFSAQEVRGWADQLEGGFSEGSGLLVAAFHSLTRIPGEKYAGLIMENSSRTLEPELYPIDPHGKLSTQRVLDGAHSRFIGAQLPDGVGKAVVDGKSERIWSSLFVPQADVVHLLEE